MLATFFMRLGPSVPVCKPVFQDCSMATGTQANYFDEFCKLNSVDHFCRELASANEAARNLSLAPKQQKLPHFSEDVLSSDMATAAMAPWLDTFGSFQMQSFEKNVCGRCAPVLSGQRLAFPADQALPSLQDYLALFAPCC